MAKRLKRLSVEEFTSLSPKHLEILRGLELIEIDKLAAINEQELRVLLDTTILKARSIIAEARASLPEFRILSLKQISQQEDENQYLSIGCQGIDKVMGGKGFETGAITEIFAEFGAGKSQIALTLAVRCVLSKEEGGLEGSVLVIDTEGTWRPSRIREIASYYPGLTKEILDENIKIIRPMRSTEQHLVLKSLVEDEGVNVQGIVKTPRPIKLLIVDSITSLFRNEYLGRGALAERQNRLGEHLKNLYLFAIQNRAIVLITNQVIHSPDIFNPGMKPVGGNVLGHASTYRVALKKKKGLLRVFQMVDSATLPDAEAIFKLSPRGIVSADFDQEDQEGGSE